MKIYPEAKRIAAVMDKQRRLVEKLGEKIDVEGFNWDASKLISGCSERNGHLYQDGRRLDNGYAGEDYYCCQYNGYCEDYYYGTLYFKTDVPGQFVAVPFEM